MESITTFGKDQKLSAAQFTAIGAFSQVTTGFFDFARKDYKKNKIDGQVEILALTGDVSIYNKEPKGNSRLLK
ncbi:MAG: DNA-binding protein [Bacteroidota bacterium]|nr:DNA-binding protein [Bacteroidota bacterium]